MPLPRQRIAGLTRPGSGAWWLCLFALVLFGFHVNYVRIHLLTEPHHYPALPHTAQDATHHDERGEHGHGDQDQHPPHAAADHQFQTSIKQHASSASLVFLPAATSLEVLGPTEAVGSLILERNEIAGVSPPDPLQARAPPLV